MKSHKTRLILKTMSKTPDKVLLFFDTVVLSNFAFARDGLAFLKKRYRTRGIVTLQVLQEIAKATYSGYQQLEMINQLLFTKNGFQKTSLNEQEQLYYIELLRNLGEGEAACIAAASQRNGIVVTDDRLARNFCKERKVVVTGTIGILRAACQDNALEPSLADQMLNDMISQGFYSPIVKISDQN